MTLQILDPSKYPKAKCLDGSPGAFYIKKSDSNTNKSWVIFLEGGGWCWDLDDCFSRASYTDLGSSVNYTEAMTEYNLWMFSEVDESAASKDNVDFMNRGMNPETHMDMSTFNKVYVKYCDGNSFSGRKSDPTSYKKDDGTNMDLYFRGKDILD